MENSINRADLFLFGLLKIPNYEQKLMAIIFLKKLNPTTEELNQKLIQIKKTLENFTNSPKLKEFLKLVLAVGNYLNRGSRGNCYGFRLTSLNKLKDTKGLGGVSLLNFLVMEIYDKFPKIADLELDFGENLKFAAKINLKDLEFDVKWLVEGVGWVKGVYSDGGEICEEVEGVVRGVEREFQVVWGEVSLVFYLFPWGFF